MKHNYTIRIMALLLAMLMLVCMVACSDNSDGGQTPADTTTAAATPDNPSGNNGDTPSDTTTVAGGTTSNELTPDLPEVSYAGKTITFLEREVENGNNVNTFFTEIYSDISLAETISNATYNRNLNVMDKYGIEIASRVELNANIANVFTSSADAGDKICDVLHANGATTMSLANKGYLRDMNTIDYINYDNPWWMGMVMDTSSIGGKNAFAIGDTNIHAFTAVSAVYFNKQLVIDLGLDSIYGLVNDGKWTIDKMYEYCQAAVAELDGDNVMTKEDRYGMIFNNYAWAPFFYGSGLTIVEKDTNDMPVLNLQNETIVNTLSKVMDFLADDNVQACSAWIEMDGGMESGFQNGHSMFYCQLMYTTMFLRQGELEFGILPTPKYDEAQDDYYSYIHNKSSYTSVPKINQDLEMTGIILEDMAYHSYKIVRPDFFDILLDGKVARDEESAEMLDIVYKNMYVCLLQPMSGVGLSTDGTMRAFITSKSGSSSMASTFKRSEAMWKKTLAQITDAFENKMAD